MRIKCDICGRFIKHWDIQVGRALFWVQTVADADGMPVDAYQVECRSCVAPRLAELDSKYISGNASLPH